LKKEFVLGELFCGPGGMALGAKLAMPVVSANGDTYSIRHAWGVDIDATAVETYNSNRLGTGIVSDALKFVSPSSAGTGRSIFDFETISGLAFGFPCNDFSLVGKQRGFQGRFGGLYKAGVEALNLANPEWFVAENVSGIHSANSGEAFREIIRSLESAGQHGYRTTVNLYRFEDYGVPQYRHRYLIVGIRRDIGFEFRVPAPTHVGRHVGAKEALERPFDGPRFNTELTRQSKTVESRLMFTPPGKNAWFLDDLVTKSGSEIQKVVRELPWYLENLSTVPESALPSLVEEARLHCTKARMSHIYRRLEPMKPSYTLTGSGGGGTHVYHWSELRALTNRERARLQGFPDEFEFKGTKEQVRKQIGMAVPPSGASVVFEAILKTMAGIDYPYTNSSFLRTNEYVS